MLGGRTEKNSKDRKDGEEGEEEMKKKTSSKKVYIHNILLKNINSTCNIIKQTN